MTILQIDSSISGADSVSRRLTDAISGQLRTAGHIVRRDLAAEPLAHLTERGQDAHLVDEFIAADTVVIGAPMYNFSVPTSSRRRSTASPFRDAASSTRKPGPKACSAESA